MALKWAVAACIAVSVWAQVPGPAPNIDPLQPPEELQSFARRATHSVQGQPQKLQMLLEAFFRSPESGGLGITYDNSRTRTVQEVWKDRQANCLGLTSLFVAACHTIGIEVHYAEPLNTSHWRRSGGVVRFERHIVAMALLPPGEDLVADFLPKLQRRQGRYVVSFLDEARVRALWASNRAVECLETQDFASAEAFARESVGYDPRCSTGWNTLGVLRGLQGDRESAEKHYRRALALDPSDGTAVGNMESLLRSEGRWEEALGYRRLGLELRKKDPYFQAFLAEESRDAGKLDEALKHIRAAIKLQPYDPDLYLTEARIRMELGKVEDATRSLELARKWANPKDRERYDTKLAAIKLLNS